MYQLFRFLGTQQLAIRQLPVFLISFVLAALFYKFGSFAIECVAFLVTWALLDYLAGFLFRGDTGHMERSEEGHSRSSMG